MKIITDMNNIPVLAVSLLNSITWRLV